MSTALRRAAAVAGALLATSLLLELGARLAAAVGALPGARPLRVSDGYWRGGHPTLGVWHHPNAEFRHRSDCYDVSYRSNDVGARDRPRPRRAEGPRVVVLGDSFLEGWGLPEEERLSNRLEAATGVPHLNFAMAHFGPYQALLAYRELARPYDHSAVLLGVVPANDFGDLDFELARHLDAYQHRYRPYLVGSAPDYRHLDHRESALHRALRRHSYAYNAVAGLDADGVFEIELPGAPARDPSWFYDYAEPQVELLEEVLRRLAREVGGRDLVVLLIPTEGDLRRHARSGADPLGARLAALGATVGFRVVDLLTAFAAEGPPFDRYFFPCDYHWSAAGNAAAARVLGSAEIRPPAPAAQETRP